MIIDCHVHLDQWELIKHEPSLLERVKLLQLTMEKHSIDYALVLSMYKIDNVSPSVPELIKAIKQYDNIGLVAGYTIQNHTAEDLKVYKNLIKEGIIKGLKLYCGYDYHYPNDEKYSAVYDICIEYAVPLMIHTGDTYSSRGKVKYAHPLHIDEVAVDHPDLKIIICHLGNPWLIDCQEVVYKNNNVFTDLSGLVLGTFDKMNQQLMLKKVSDLITYINSPDKILYGTDWPICDMGSYLTFLSNLNLKTDYKDHILYKNAKRLFNL